MLTTLNLVACLLSASGGAPEMAPPDEPGSALTDWLLFASGYRVGAIRPDGTGETYPDFGLRTERRWTLAYVFPGGREAELQGLDSGTLWSYDFVTRTRRGIERRMGLPLPGGERYFHSSNVDNVFSMYTTDRDGGHREDIYSVAGYAYGVGLSPDGGRVVFHLTNNPARPGYEICVVDLASRGELVIASAPQYLHFGPVWSPDGQWLLYQRCEHLRDPGHDRSDLCLSRADGSEHRLLTTGQRHWFAAAMGTPERHSSGSNLPVWSPDGSRIACALLLPDSRTAWPWAEGRADTDHFNRDYHPELARGGTQICLIDVQTGGITPITHDDPPTWYFRLAWSPDGSRLAYMRADVGALPELWVRDADGGSPRFLTRGLNGTGADHVSWRRLPVAAL